MTDLLTRATFAVAEDSLRKAVLERDMLPQEFADFEVFREGLLDNAAMAKQGFPGTSAEGIRQHGRITGFLKEFMSPPQSSSVTAGANVAVATVVHLFESDTAVLRWIDEVFSRQFEEHVGHAIAPDQDLLGVSKLPVRGFHDHAAALRALQSGPKGLVSSTIVDFRLGRILGVTYVVAYGDVERLALAEQIGVRLERQIVRVVLGAA